MNDGMHERAERLIAQERVEGISADERKWLGAHLAECAACAARRNATEQAIRSLRGLSVPLPRALASRTQMRVRLRAQQMRAVEPRWRMVWAACGVSWAFGALTAPYVWRALEWIGHRVGLPDFVWEMGFGLWWALPAAIVAMILLMENAGRRSEASWNRLGN
jgi:anti-sigma factor RsiW